MRIAIATFSARPAEFDDDERLGEELAGRGASVDHLAWESEDADWSPYDAVIIRSTWDYAYRRDEFVAWADRVGERLHNSPDVIRWNSDKRYLGDLAEAGFATVPTTYVEPGDELPGLEGEVVVKPNVSGGARDTGRFSPATHSDAHKLIAAIQEQGKAAMVQPYVESVDSAGETAVVCFDGEPAYALRKGAVLKPSAS